MGSPLAARNSFRLHSHTVIAAILIVGFALRIIGINVGLPNTPDPREAIIAQDILNLAHFRALPQTYNWPGTAWFYLIAAITKLLSLSGLHMTEAHLILVARCINVILSTITLWFTYGIGCHVYNRRNGHIAAALLAVSMLHATNESRFALVDIPATFCVTLFLWIVIRVRTSSAPPPFRTVVWLGILLGTSFAVKFTTAFVALSFFVCIGSTDLHRKFATIAGVAASTFTLLCPYWLIDIVSPQWNFFFEDFWYEATHYHRGHFGLIATAETVGLKRFVHLWTLLKWGGGVPLAFLIGCGVLRPLIQLKRSPTCPELPLLAFAIPYLLFIGMHKVKFARHLLILYPTFTVLAAATLTRIPDAIRSFFKFTWRESPHLLKREGAFEKWSIGIVCGVVLLYSFVYTFAFATVMLAPPTRMTAAEWIATNVPQTESIAHAPVILFDWLLPPLDFDAADEETEWILVLRPDLEVFQKYLKHPQHYRNVDWYPIDNLELEEALAFYARILGEESPYQLHKTFRHPLKFLSIQISDSGAPFPMRALAHPEILIYRYRN